MFGNFFSNNTVKSFDPFGSIYTPTDTITVSNNTTTALELATGLGSITWPLQTEWREPGTENDAEGPLDLSGVPKLVAEPSVPALKPHELPGEDYLEVARRVGLAHTSAVRHALFMKFLQEQEIPVYSYADVDKYLEERCQWMQTKHGGRAFGWFWSKLEVLGCDGKAEFGQLGPFSGVRAASVHDKPVPIEALRVVERVNAFHDKKNLAWGVTAIRRDPDPFLGVHYAGRWSVLFHWDEPGFSIVKKS